MKETTLFEQPRYQTAVSHFQTLYGPGDITVFRAPGRVNLIGEHTDYNHGYVMPVAIDRDVVILARSRADGVVRLANVEPDFAPFSFTLSRDIPSAPPGDWSNYVRGAAQMVARQVEQRPLIGFDGLVVAAPPFGVPRGAGLSSSSALTVAAAVTLAHLNEWQPPLDQFAARCSRAEWYVGTRGGVMDHFASLLGRPGQALFLDCRPGENGRYATQYATLPSGYQLLIANSGVKHRNVGGGYNYRVAACRAGVALLRRQFAGVTHLRDVENVDWMDLEPLLPEETAVSNLIQQGIDLGDIPNLPTDARLRVRANCRHVWSENWRVRQAVDALNGGDIARLGQLLHAAHASARDDYDISCPEIETLVGILNSQPGVLGARLTGAGWGGCVVALVEAGEITAVVHHAQTAYHAATGIDPDVFVCTPSGGAGFVAALER